VSSPIWGPWPDICYCVTITVLFLWGALSGERTGLSFLCAAGPCQRRRSRVWVPSDLRPYFTVSDLRLPFSSPPTTRRVTVELFDPASTRGELSWVLCYDRWSAGQSVLEQSTLLGLTTRSLLLSDNCGFVDFEAPSLTRGRVCHLQFLLALAIAVIFWSESHRTRGHILLSQIWDFPFRRLLRFAGSRWR
jgi:hypothetical protein